MFRGAFGIIVEVVLEIKAAIARQFAEDPELSFAGLKRGAHVLRRESGEIDPGFLESPASHFLEPLVAELPDIFAVEPGAFIEIEGRVLAMHFRQVEQLDNLSEVE